MVPLISNSVFPKFKNQEIKKWHSSSYILKTFFYIYFYFQIFSEIIFDSNWSLPSTTISASLSDISSSPSTSNAPSEDEENLTNANKCLNKTRVGLSHKIYANQNCNSVSYAYIHIHIKIGKLIHFFPLDCS